MNMKEIIKYVVEPQSLKLRHGNTKDRTTYFD